MTQISRDAPSRSSTIVDSPKVFLLLLGTIGLLAMGCCIFFYTLFHVFTGKAEPSALVVGGFYACICIGLSPVLYKIFRVNAKGYVIDTENDIFEFPGGGIVADSFLSYFNTEYLLQWFSRHQIRLSEIRGIQAYRVTSTNTSRNTSGKLYTSTSNQDKLDITGDFGAVSFFFMSKGKRDQLHSAIVSLNKMGDPMLRR